MSKRGKGRECHYCGRKLHAAWAPGKLAATKDHVIPKSKTENLPGFLGHRLVWSCRQCNMLKRDMMPAEWIQFMKQNPNWWTNPNYQHGSNIRGRSAR